MNEKITEILDLFGECYMTKGGEFIHPQRVRKQDTICKNTVSNYYIVSKGFPFNLDECEYNVNLYKITK